jgi:hypothetical protein
MLKLRNQYSNTPLLHYPYLNRNAQDETLVASISHRPTLTKDLLP